MAKQRKTPQSLVFGQPVGLKLVPDPDASAPPPIYTNFIQGNFTPEDFVLHLGWYALPALSEPPTETVEVPVQPVARVVVPLNLMRSLIGLLQRQVDAYEESFGPVPEHPNPPTWLAERQAPDGE